MRSRGELRDFPGTAGEAGSAILLVLCVLFALTALAPLWMISARADLLIAARMKKEREAFYAAEGVLEEAVVLLNDPGSSPLPEDVFFHPPPGYAAPLRKGRLAGWEFAWQAALVPDVHDADGDSSTHAVLFDRAFGYGDSPFDRGGFPLFQLRIDVESRSARKALVAEVAPQSFNPTIEAAWTAAGELNLERMVFISGKDHDGDGRPLPLSTSDQSGILARGAIVLGDGASATGRTGEEALTDPDMTLAEEPLAALNPGGTLERLADLPPPASPLRGAANVPGDYFGPLEGAGVLVIHNPRFHPVLYEASRLAMEEGLFTPDYDPSYSHLDPQNSPAVLEILEGGSFHGLVVADTVGFVFDDALIVGALVTLSRSPVTVRAVAPLRVLYSGSALRTSACGPLKHRVSFKALSEKSGWME